MADSSSAAVPATPSPTSFAVAEVVPDLVPVSMLNAFSYCPRLFFLEWVDAQRAENADLAEGQWVHRRVDEPGGRVPSATAVADPVPIRARSVALSCPELGLVARIDALEGDGATTVPVELKKGRPPELPERSWEPERVQLCAQGLLLRANGYPCEEGTIFYAESRERVRVPFDEALVARTRDLLAELRDVAARAEPPPPLVDSSKCPRCSLVGICLPDEVNTLSERSQRPPRRLLPAAPDPTPLYVVEQGAVVTKRQGRLVVKAAERELASVRMLDVSQVCLYGSVQVTTQALRALLAADVPVCYFSFGGWFTGMSTGLPGRNVELRRRQVVVAAQGGLRIASAMVGAKIRNARTVLRRNGRDVPPRVLDSLAALAARAGEVGSAEELLGVEGAAARLYFERFGSLLRPPRGGDSLPGEAFRFEGRNRRPPLDPVNCMLSFLYGLLAKELTVATFAIGLDPFIGMYHRPRFGRPALALDLAEEFRAVVADSVVLRLVNTGEIRASDFVVRARGVSLTERGRKTVLGAYERRMAGTVRHPTFGYTVSYRRLLEVQARVLGAVLLGECSDYQPFVTR